MQRKISVVLRSFNDEKTIDRVLNSISRQSVSVEEVICLDNESKDRTRQIIKSYSPLTKLHTVKRGSYIPGTVLNLGVSKAFGDTVIFLNSDAVPLDDTCFEKLLSRLFDNTVVYARQIPRPDARVAVRYDYHLCFPDESSNSKITINNTFFSIVCAAATTKLIKTSPIPEDIQYSEDTLWADQLQSLGIAINYQPAARVEHSHNYSYREAVTRFHNEGVSESNYTEYSRIRLLILILISPLRVISSILKDYQYSRTHNLAFGMTEIVYSAKLRYAQKLHKPWGLLTS